MKAIMKDGTEYEIDTTCLFNDQYNTVPAPGEKEGKRIFDGQIARIIDDVRVGLGKCKYCGAIVRKGEEENHFTEREAKTCDGCFWWQKELIDTTTNSEKTIKRTDESGCMITEEVRKITQKWKYGCRYKGTKTDCTNKECRAFGIEWFTPKNTFFLRKPNGFELIKADNLSIAGFEKNGALAWTYAKKIGTYTLEADVVHDNGEVIGVKAFSISNSRVRYRFRYEDGAWFTYDYTFGWEQRKRLEYVPDNVIEKVKKIMMEVEGNDNQV